MKRQRITIVSVVVAVTLLPVGFTNAGKLYSNRQCATTRGSVPKHHYGHETPRFGATEFAVANDAVGEGNLRRKTFHFRATALKVDQLQLDQVGLAIYQGDKQAQLVATGRITQDGGDGGLIGNNVTIRIRAYVASSADPKQIPPDAVVVWRTERKLWISRGRPQYVSLAPEPAFFTQALKSGHFACCPDWKSLTQAEDLHRHFDDITHLEVEMEWERDR